MRTVPTLLATGAGIPLAAAGFKLALNDDSRIPISARREPEMTTVATYTLSTLDRHATDLDLRESRAFSSPIPLRTAADVEYGRRMPSHDIRPGSKSRSLTPRADDTRLYPGSRPQAWLRRWSSSVSASRDSSAASTSRPSSAAISHSNASITFSHSGSNTPIFLHSSPPSLPPNKLVKRAASTHSSSSSSKPRPGSRLPLPVLKRPATSHQRSLTLREQLRDSSSDQAPSADQVHHSRDSHWQHYFTPRVEFEERVPGRRRSSTAIPNPIKRIYPQRKHLPVLVSARELVLPAQVGMDDDVYRSDDDDLQDMLAETASSPLPSRPETRSATNPSLSLNGMFPSGQIPLWKRPSSSRGKSPANKLTKTGRQRLVSEPDVTMGSSLSITPESGRPAKRRDTMSDKVPRHSNYSSSSSSHQYDSRISHPSQPPRTRSAHLSADDSPLFGTSPDRGSLLPSGERRTTDISILRPGRVSATQSELTSTTGSDSERQSVGGYSTDNQSDTVFDTIPTQRSNSGKRGPPIETIFDDSPPPFSSGRSTRLRDFLSDGNFPGGERAASHRHSTIEEEESIVSTPVRSVRDKHVGFTPSSRTGVQHDFTSSPPAPLDAADPGIDDIDWDVLDMGPVDESEDHDQTTDLSNPFHSNLVLDGARAFPFHFGALSRSVNAASTASSPHRNGSGNAEKANLFDWSEQLPSPVHHNSPPRPRTVHGKKDPENRGSRAAGRRPPSGMHARSHSVPVVPDVDGKRPSVIANKFGTWGVGSKAVTEDWNEDFDFDEASIPMPDASSPDGKRIDSAMFVPKSIREQQENVVANIGLLREWGLLIEELKDLRIRAFALDMISGDGHFARAWKEVDAMIDLADQETEEETLEPRRSPPSSPGFDYSAFEEPLGIAHAEPGNAARPRATVIRAEAPLPNGDVRQNHLSIDPHGSPRGNLHTRPRKDSEAVARSVIEALQSKRAASQSTSVDSNATTKKLPFDTATLRHIVPYVNGLKRKVKDGLREKEGLYSSPRRPLVPNENDHDETHDDDDGEPAFRSIFNDPGMGSPVRERRIKREMAMIEHDNSTEDFTKQTNELADRVHLMTLPW
nr:hypothetical protein CFP56_00990 [Quercus suber]